MRGTRTGEPQARRLYGQGVKPAELCHGGRKVTGTAETALCERCVRKSRADDVLGTKLRQKAALRVRCCQANPCKRTDCCLSPGISKLYLELSDVWIVGVEVLTAQFFGFCFDMQMLSWLQAEEELQEGCARQALQLQEMGRRERLLRADVSRAKEQVGRRQG